MGVNRDSFFFGFLIFWEDNWLNGGRLLKKN